jgi:hypothetical protein
VAGSGATGVGGPVRRRRRLEPVERLAIAVALALSLGAAAPVGGSSGPSDSMSDLVALATALLASPTPSPRGGRDAGAGSSPAPIAPAPWATPVRASESPGLARSPSPTAAAAPGPAAPRAAYRVEPIPLKRLPIGLGPLDGSPATSPRLSPPDHDADGVPMARVDGHLVYKPAGLAQEAIRFMNGYARSGDPAYLAVPRAIGRALVRIGRLSRGALFLPYASDFAMHGSRKDVIRAPWYSAMAQGLALALFTKLYAATGNPQDLATAGELLLSLSPAGRGAEPWVSYVDSGRYLWLEEYAQPDPDHAVNGFIFAAFGLYEYWRETGDPGAAEELRGALTTLRHHLMAARKPGGPMDYCLKHGRPQLKYHRVVVAQLKLLVRMTGDPFFAEAVRIFERDA